MHQRAGAGPSFRRFAPTLRPQMATLAVQKNERA